MAKVRGTAGITSDENTLTRTAMAYHRGRVLTAAARLGVADALGDEERTVEQLADLCHANAPALYRLLRALASFGVVRETTPGNFVLEEYGRPLRKDAANSEWASVVFWGDLLADSWSHLTACIQTGERADAVMQREGVRSLWSREPDADAIFRGVMGTAPAADYMPIAGAFDFAPYHTVADLGGGGGGLIAAVLAAFPQVKGMLVDRPPSIESARARFEAAADRCELISADLTVAVPAGADVYMMKHVLHGYQDEAAAGILRNCRAVLPDRGRVLLIEFVLPDVVDHPDIALEHRCMCDLNMLAVTGGKERSGVEWRALLTRSGFDCLGIVPVPGDLVSIIEARPLKCQS